MANNTLWKPLTKRKNMETREELIKKFTLAKEIIEKRDCLLDQIESFEDDIEEDEEKLFPSSTIDDLKAEQQKYSEPYKDNGLETYLPILGGSLFGWAILIFVGFSEGNGGLTAFLALIYCVFDIFVILPFFNIRVDIFHPDFMTLIYLLLPVMLVSLILAINEKKDTLTFSQRKRIYDDKKAEIDETLLEVETFNKTIEQRNAERRKKISALESELDPIHIRWDKEASSWYPEDYKTLDAVEFFIKKLKNYQAETKAEVINLYDEYLHRENLENLQQEAIENQLEAQYRHELRMQGFQQDLQQRLNDVRENLEDAIESEQNRHQAGQDEIMDKLNEMNSKHR